MSAVPYTRHQLKDYFMISHNFYQFAELQAHLVSKLLAHKLFTEVHRATRRAPEARGPYRHNSAVSPAVVVDLSPEAKELLKHLKAPYI